MNDDSALLLDDALKLATPLTNGAINETLRQFASLSDDCLLQLVDCRESSNSPDLNPVDYTEFTTINQLQVTVLKLRQCPPTCPY